MKEHWILRVTKWEWTPIILGAVVGFSSVAIAADGAVEAAPGGFGLILFAWIALVKGFAK
jgi:hypothetical protein